MARWHLHHGRWWMVQWSINGWLSLGVHVDFRRRSVGDGRTFGPYVDLHVGPVIVSVGNNPVWSGNHQADHGGRGGVRVPSGVP